MRFSEELKLLRERRGVSLQRLSELVGWDASLFGKMEHGQTLGGPEVVQALDQFYGTDDKLLILWELALGDPTQFKEQYQLYMTLEARAVRVWRFSPSIVPGPLQTPGYARELLTAGGLQGEELDQQVEARLGRRNVLAGEDPPPFRAILSEAVLRNSLRDPREWREQLEHLVEMSARPNVTLYVLPFSAGLHGLMDTSVTFLQLPEGHTVAYAEDVLQNELHKDNGKVEDLQRRYDAIRDRVENPDKSRAFILRLLEEVSCEPST